MNEPTDVSPDTDAYLDYGDHGGPPETQAEFFARWWVARVEEKAEREIARRARRRAVAGAVIVVLAIVGWVVLR